jgi:hypothetical protein
LLEVTRKVGENDVKKPLKFLPLFWRGGHCTVVKSGVVVWIKIPSQKTHASGKNGVISILPGTQSISSDRNCQSCLLAFLPVDHS